MNIGVYNLHILVGLFGKPKSVIYFLNIEKGVDTLGILLVIYNKFKVISVVGKDCVSPNYINLMDDKGYIHSTSRSNLVTDFNLCLRGQETEKINLHKRKIHERLAYEIIDFCEVISHCYNNKYQECKNKPCT